jgi:hypothetical protein
MVEETPSQLEQQLAASLDQVAQRGGSPVVPINGGGRFAMLRFFSGLKKRYEGIQMLKTYYGFLGLHGVRHSNEWPDTQDGIREARACYKEMLADITRREIAMEVRV